MRHASSVGPGGERSIDELAALAERLDAAHRGPVEDPAPSSGLAGAVLYLRDACGFSRAVRVALDNLHQQGIEIRNVSRDEAAQRSLREASGAETAPCLVLDGEVVRESPVIIARLAERVCRLR